MELSKQIMFFSYGPKYTLGIYNLGNMKGKHDSHKYHIPTKTILEGILFRNTYME